MKTDITLMVLQVDAVTDMRHVVETIERDRRFREHYEQCRRAYNIDQNKRQRNKNKKL